MKLASLAMALPTIVGPAIDDAAASRLHPLARTASIQCGAFSAEARTVVYDKGEIYAPSTSQILIARGKSPSLTMRLDLDQHFSPDRRIAGRRSLDGLAREWRCFHAPPGRDYLFVEFSCVNPDAGTCPTAMDMPGSEWSQVYSAAGEALIHDPRTGTSGRDERRLRALGIWSALWQGMPYKETKFIYVDDPRP